MACLVVGLRGEGAGLEGEPNPRKSMSPYFDGNQESIGRNKQATKRPKRQEARNVREELTVRKLSITLAAMGLAAHAGMALAAPEGDPEKGKQAAAMCTACHQADGSGKHVEGGESWPRLAGMNAAYLAKQLHDFKNGDRQNASMMPFANMLSDQQIADVAAYYAQLEPTPGQGGENASEAVLKRGEQIAERGDWSEYVVSCKSCHGPDSRGAGATFPGIAGQHAGYIKAQLKAWQEGSRSNDPQNLMGAVAKRMSNEDIHAVAVWLANQSPVAE